MIAVLERLRRSLPGVWLGLLLAIALLAAPSLFSLLERADAGRVAARLFALEARVSLALAVVLIVLERSRGARRASAGAGTRLGVDLLLVLGTLFCTVLGHYALEPMLAAARAGESRWSFAALHGVAAAFYAVKALLVAALTWRASGGGPPRGTADPGSAGAMASPP